MIISTAILQAFAAWSASEAAEDDATVEAEADRFGEQYGAICEAEPASIEEVPASSPGALGPAVESRPIRMAHPRSGPTLPTSRHPGQKGRSHERTHRRHLCP
jgi:hypothetical protein